MKRDLQDMSDRNASLSLEEIDWLIAQCYRMRVALAPFAFLGSILIGKEEDGSIFVGQVSPDGVHHPVTFGDFRRATEALK